MLPKQMLPNVFLDPSPRLMKMSPNESNSSNDFVMRTSNEPNNLPTNIQNSDPQKCINMLEILTSNVGNKSNYPIPTLRNPATSATNKNSAATKNFNSRTKPLEKRLVKCEYCNYHGKGAYKVKIHKMNCHSDLRPFKCTFCSYASKQKCTMTRHLKSHGVNKTENTETNSSELHFNLAEIEHPENHFRNVYGPNSGNVASASTSLSLSSSLLPLSVSSIPPELPIQPAPIAASSSSFTTPENEIKFYS